MPEAGAATQTDQQPAGAALHSAAATAGGTEPKRSGTAPAPATGLKAELARTFVRTLGRIDNPSILLVALPRAQSFVPAGPAGLALLHELAGYAEWPARSIAARLLGERAAGAGPEAQAAAWAILLELAADKERWVTESASWGLGALLRADPERWGAHFRAAFDAECEDSSPLTPRSSSLTPAVRRTLLFAVVPALGGPPAARQAALDVIDRAAAEDSSVTRQLGSLIVGRQVSEQAPDEALDLVERWAASGEPPRQWQAARSLSARLRELDSARTTAIVRTLQAVPDPAIQNALRGALKDQDDEASAITAPPRPHAFTTPHASPPKPPPDWRSTAEIPVGDRIIDQMIGQDKSVEIVRLAARQRRFVLMVGEPGTGKSMLAAAMAELMGAEDVEDVLVVPNAGSRISPLVEVVPAGEGERAVAEARRRRGETETAIGYLFAVALLAVSLIAGWYAFTTRSFIPALVGMVVGFVLLGVRRFFRSPARLAVPKLLVNNAAALEADRAPFVDATGFHAGALLGDVRHDPFQSGGYETPPHELVEPGAIHLAHRGVLFIDEVSTLSIESQQSLLTAIQEKRFPISGRTLGSSGTMIRSAPAPCDFLLILAGNMQDVEKMHPALRSRVRGYGYELYLNEDMPDTVENRDKLARFCAQEVLKDHKIPHLRRDAVEAIVQEACVRAGRRDRLTTRLRELGGLIRAAGDLAVQEGAELVEPRHVLAARENTRTLEEQIHERSPRGAAG